MILRHSWSKTLALFMFVVYTINAKAAEQFVSFQPSSDVWQLKSFSVGYCQGEHSCVQLAVQNLLSDIEKVTGQNALTAVDGIEILVGTVGVNKQVDQWVKQGELRDLKGKTEKYVIKTIGNQLVIAGSDKRGTVYGIYELSKQMGVSPWYYWADVPVEKHTHIYIKKGEYTDGEPAVRYRGLFLNDEAPCLTTWVKNTFGTDFGGHKFYEKVFELILRLKGNYLWPAMWGWAFYADDPENLKTADKMGVMMGTSHHEPMARNHQEYARHRKEWGAWNYSVNKNNLDRFFREGIERMKNTDDIVTIGMRGDGDEAMGNSTDTKLLEDIINNQRRIIKDVTKRPAKETPQIWALYKEVQDYYDAGLRVPDDVTILLCDDNWGNVRRIPTAEERKRKGGWGLYYHVDYVGAPRNSKWINVTPIQNMWEQLQLAYNGGIQKLWILNVGDLKPMEYPIQLFMEIYRAALFSRLCHIEDAEGYHVGSTAGHRIFDVFNGRDGRSGVHERVILHHALVHAVESDVVAVRGDVLALVDTPFAAVNRFAEDDMLARVGTEQYGLEAVQRTLHEHAFVVLDDEQLVLDVLVNHVVRIHLVERLCGDFAFQHGEGFVVTWEIEGVRVNPFVAERTGNLVRFL